VVAILPGAQVATNNNNRNKAWEVSTCSESPFK